MKIVTRILYQLILRNSAIFWIRNFWNNLVLQFKHREQKLSLGNMSVISDTIFGFNLRILKSAKTSKSTIANNVLLHENTIIDTSQLDSYTTVYANSKIFYSRIGTFTYVAPETEIWYSTIGNYCSIGPGCRIGLGFHPSSVFISTHPVFFSTLCQSQITFSDQNYFEETKPISIGSDVWIGANAIIMGGVRIGNGAIIGAGAVVTKDIPAYAIVGGVPAKIIRYRFNNSQIEKLEQSKWWDLPYNAIKERFKDFHNFENFEKQLNQNH